MGKEFFLYFSSFQCFGQGDEENTRGQGKMYPHISGVAHTALVCNNVKTGLKENNLQTSKWPTDATKQSRVEAPTSREVIPGSNINQLSICKFDQLSHRSKNILEASIRNSTKNKYKVYWRKWDTFCSENQINETNVSIISVINFLSKLFEDKASYSVIKAAKAALTHKVSLPTLENLGDHPLLKKFMRGVFNLKPPKAKTGFIWDVKILFDYFENLPNNIELDDSTLTQKTLCLLLLLSGSI